MHHRKDKVAVNRAGPSNPTPRYQADDNDDSNEPQRSCNLDDDDDENLFFSQEFRNTTVPSHYVVLKIPEYNGRGDRLEQLQNSHEPTRRHLSCEM